MRALLLACFFLPLSVLADGVPAQYHLEHEYVLGGDGGWDDFAFDSVGQRLFLSRATRVMVVDAAKGTLLAEIPDTAGVHEIALAQDLGKGFTSNGKEDTVTVFDLKTLKPLSKIKVTGGNPDAIMYEPVTRRVFTFNGHGGNATVIDAVSGAVVATIPLAGKPEFAVADGKGMVYVNIEDKSELSTIDARKATVVNTWSLAPCESPSGLAMDVKNRRLFAGCDNKLMAVMDADTGKVVASLPIGAGVDGTGFDPGTGLAFSSNGEGSLTVIHEDSPDKYSVLQDAATRKFARTMTLDPASHRVYLVTAEVELTPDPQGGRPKRTVLPGTFKLLVMGPQR